MSTKTTSHRTRSLLGAALTCMLLSGTLAAQDRLVTVAIHVSARGLDLTRARDAQTFYSRLEKAAWAACMSGNRVDLAPVDDFQNCYDQALAGAVRSAKTLLITQIYLNSHTSEETVAQRIEMLAKMKGR